MQFICLDIETTGLNQEENDIIEVAAVKFDESNILERFQTFINFKKPIPAIVEHLTGITLEMTKNAPMLQDVKQQILDFCGDLPIVGHNINFDINFLKEKGVVLNNTLFDTLPLSHILINDTPSHSLEILSRKLNKQYFPTHRAEDDCTANIELFHIFLLKIKSQNSSCNYYWQQILSKTNSDWAQILLNLIPNGQKIDLKKAEYLDKTNINRLENNNKTIKDVYLNISELKDNLTNLDLIVLSETQEKTIKFEYTKIHDTNSEISYNKFLQYLNKQSFEYNEAVLLLKIAKLFSEQNTVYKDDLNLFGEDYQYLSQVTEFDHKIKTSNKPYLINHYTFFKLLNNNLLPNFSNIYFENLPFIEETYIRANEHKISLYESATNNENDELSLAIEFRNLAKFAIQIKTQNPEQEIREAINIDLFSFTNSDFQQTLNNIYKQTKNQDTLNNIDYIQKNYQSLYIWIYVNQENLASLHFIPKNLNQNFDLKTILLKSPTQNIFILNSKIQSKNLTLFCANQLNDPNSFGFNKQIKEYIFEKLKDLDKQALIISPAKVQITELHKQLAKEFANLGITLLTQDISGSKGKLLDNIENLEGPIVLLCTQYFYLRNFPKLSQLQKVFITKLPMSLPNHIYYEYKKSEVQNSFMELLVPNTANTIYQILHQAEQESLNLENLNTNSLDLESFNQTTSNFNSSKETEYYILDNRIVTKEWGIAISNKLPNNINITNCQ